MIDRRRLRSEWRFLWMFLTAVTMPAETVMGSTAFA